jgi:hypothetical protein
MKKSAVLSVLFLLLACKGQMAELLELDIAITSIPEGIAVDPKTGDIYISSLHLDKITRSAANGKNSTDVVGSGQYGYTTGVGMETARNLLFALGSDNRTKKSLLLQIDLKNDSLVNRASLPDSIPGYFNDLALDENMNAYITDTEFHKVYKYDSHTDNISPFMENEQIKYPNGIAISDDGSKLFIDSYSAGIRIVDIQSRQILNVPHQPSAEKGIDGLKYYKNSLYAVVNGAAVDPSAHGLYRFRLSENEETIVSMTPIAINHAKMEIPTTVDIEGDRAYLLLNSQLENLDQQRNEIIEPAKLSKTYVLKLDLKSMD